MKRFLKITLIGFTLLQLPLIAWLLVNTIRNQRVVSADVQNLRSPTPGGSGAMAQGQQDSAATIGIATPDPIVGIWKGQHGVILDLRADGTVRRRSIDDKTDIQYYKYRLRGKELSIYYSAKPDEYLRRLRHAVFGMTAETYVLRTLSNSEFQLIDPASGVTFVFARIEDSVLAAAP